MKSLRPLIVAAVVALAGTGCFSRLTGNQGKFVFGYPAVADIGNFNKPIAPGARLDLHAFEIGSGDQMTVVRAESKTPEVLQVVSIQRGAAVLQGATNGAARIELTAVDARGAELTDTVDMLVARPDAMVLEHSCTDDLFAAYPANSDDVFIPFRMQRAGGQPVIGYGFHPIKVSPKSSLTLDRGSRDQGALHFRTRKPRHRVAIRSRIDDAYLGLTLVDPSEMDDVIADPVAGVGTTIVGAETMVSLQPLVSGVALCQSPLYVTAKTKTPAYCDATARLSDDGPARNRFDLVRVTGRRYGVCEFEVEYAGANGGEGLRKTFRMPVGKFPTLEEKAPSRPWWLTGLLGLLAPLLLYPVFRRVIRGSEEE